MALPTSLGWQEAIDEMFQNRNARGASRIAAQPLFVRLIGGSRVDRIADHRVRCTEELRVLLNRPDCFGSDSDFRFFVFHGYHPLLFVA